MPRTISGRILRLRTFLLQLLQWSQANWEMRKWSSQRSLWGKSCTWAVGVPVEDSRLKKVTIQWVLVELRWCIQYKTYCTRHGRFWSHFSRALCLKFETILCWYLHLECKLEIAMINSYSKQYIILTTVDLVTVFPAITLSQRMNKNSVIFFAEIKIRIILYRLVV